VLTKLGEDAAMPNEEIFVTILHIHNRSLVRTGEENGNRWRSEGNLFDLRGVSKVTGQPHSITKQNNVSPIDQEHTLTGYIAALSSGRQWNGG
jgi:hypothetical protein